MMKTADGIAADAVVFEPSGEMAAAIAGQVGDFFGIRINAGKDSGEDRIRCLEIHFRLKPETAGAGVGEGQTA